jgi:hypothetical protein
LSAVCIPSRVEMLGKDCFAECESLSTVTFAAGSRLARIEEQAFLGCSRLPAICIPSSVETLGEECFKWCGSLSTVTFAAGSRLARIKAGTFTGSSQAWAILPNGERISAQEFGRGWSPESPLIPVTPLLQESL